MLASIGSWEGESVHYKQKREPSSKDFESPPKQNVCFDVEEKEKVSNYSVWMDECYIMMGDTMNHGSANTTPEKRDGMPSQVLLACDSCWDGELTYDKCKRSAKYTVVPPNQNVCFHVEETSDCSKTSAGDEQTEGSSSTDKLGSECSFSQDSLAFVSSWEGELAHYK